MHARLKADLYGACLTSPELLRHAIDHATQRAAPAPRLTPSRRYRRWKVIAVRALTIAACLAVYFGVTQ